MGFMEATAIVQHVPSVPRRGSYFLKHMEEIYIWTFVFSGGSRPFLKSKTKLEEVPDVLI